jgi:hypothetical protein
MKNIERFAMVFVVGCCIITGIVVYNRDIKPVNNTELSDKLKLKDDTLRLLDMKLDSLTLVNDSLERITLWQMSKIDTTIKHIEKLSKPVITDQDTKEALKWVENYNKSL